MKTENSNTQQTKTADNEAKSSVDCRVSVPIDKNGIPINIGDTVKIENSRKNISQIGIIELVDGELKIKHETGKYSTVKIWLDSIWWRNDEPENFIEVLAH